MKSTVPVHINQPDPESKNLADRLHNAVFHGKIGDVLRFLDIGNLIFCVKVTVGNKFVQEFYNNSNIIVNSLIYVYVEK